MFGYLVPDKQELKVKDFALYRAAYCGICRAIKLEYGNLPRLAVSYDAAVLTVLLIGAAGGGAQAKPRRCALNPLRAKPVLEENEALSFSAAVSVLLAYGRLQDAWADERQARALPAMAGLIRARNKAKNRYPALAQEIQIRLAELAALEKGKCAELDRTADVMGNLLGAILFQGAAPGSNPSLLRNMGYHLGRWIYLMDAIDDLTKDEKSGAYNTLIAMGGDREAAVSLAAAACEFAAAQAAALFDLMEIRWGGDIISNLLYAGMPKMLEKVLTKENCKG